jgi:hypothetical protein
MSLNVFTPWYRWTIAHLHNTAIINSLVTHCKSTISNPLHTPPFIYNNQSIHLFFSLSTCYFIVCKFTYSPEEYNWRTQSAQIESKNKLKQKNKTLVDMNSQAKRWCDQVFRQGWYILY